MTGRNLGRRSSDAAQARCDQARLELARLHVNNELNLRSAWNRLSTVVADTMRVERVGIWMVVEEGRAIRCQHLLQQSVHEVFEGAVLRSEDFPAYFDALEQNRTIEADDALGSVTTGDLRDAYLQPLGITSMLDAPIFREGRVVGVVCHEHVGVQRHWSPVESAFAGSVADTIARLYEEDARLHAETSLQAYERHMLELHRTEAVGRMAAGIAHDFRGILGVVLGYAQLILRAPNSPADVEKNAKKIVDAIERGRRLTQEVTNFVREHPVSPRILDVHRAVEGVLPMLRTLVGDAVEVDAHIEPAVSRVFMDPTHLERTLLNLTLNARDAMPNGGALRIHVRESVRQDELEGATSFVSITVSDTGIGMDAPTLEQAVKPFFTTKGDQGTGLGLAIVDQIVSRAGGYLEIQSEPGKGTEVHVLLPRIAIAA